MIRSVGDGGGMTELYSSLHAKISNPVHRENQKRIDEKVE
jgi:hypothetical protein